MTKVIMEGPPAEERRIIHRTRMLVPSSAPKRKQEEPSWSSEMREAPIMEEEDENETCVIL